MKGSLYCDFINSKASLIIAALMSFGYGIVIFGMRFDDVETDETRYFFMLFIVIFILMCWVSVSAMSLSVTKPRIKAYWIAFPQCKKGYVLSKYLYAFIVLTVGCLFAFLIALSSGQHIEIKMFFSLISGAFALLWISLGFIMVFGESKGTTIILVIVMLITYSGLGYILFGDLTFLVELTAEKVTECIEKISKTIGTVTIIANPILMVLSYLFVVKFMPVEKGFE